MTECENVILWLHRCQRLLFFLQSFIPFCLTGFLDRWSQRRCLLLHWTCITAGCKWEFKSNAVSSLPHIHPVHRCCRDPCRSTGCHHAPAASCMPHRSSLLTGSTGDISCWLKENKRNCFNILFCFGLRWPDYNFSHILCVCGWIHLINMMNN